MYRSGPASGENRVVEDEARLLTEGGHQVDIFAPGIGEPSRRELMSAAAATIWSRQALAEVRRRIHTWKPDIIHCHNLFPALSPAVLRADDRVPIVLTLHNYRLLCLPATFLRDGRVCEDCLGRAPWPGVVHGCYQGSSTASAVMATSMVLHRAIHTFRRIRLYIAISDFVRHKHIEAGFPTHEIVVKPHFAWPADLRQGPGEYFVYLGRVSPEKGVATLVEAWKRLGTRLLVVGDGPEVPRLRSVAPPNVEFRGTVTPAEAARLVSRARAVLAPSVSHEGAGKVVLEAYAAGVPVLVSRADGLPEVVEHEVTGLVLPPTDPRAWVEGVERLLDDKEAERMGTSARELWSSRYTPEEGLVNLERAYQRVLS
jgi:glycosyltransferase involved in cell wall biosynthesis